MRGGGVGEWRALWEPVGIVAGSPEEMSAWRDDYLSLEGAIAGLDERNKRASSSRRVHFRAGVGVEISLRNPWKSTGVRPPPAPGRFKPKRSSTKRERSSMVGGGSRPPSGRRMTSVRHESKDLARAEQDLEKWRTAWFTTLDVLGLSAKSLLVGGT